MTLSCDCVTRCFVGHYITSWLRNVSHR